jgi:N-methylhydantoinase B
VRKVVKVIGEMSLNTRIERTHGAPWGLFEGRDARANKLSIRRADGTVEELPNGKVSMLKLGPGDAYMVESGGGGYGDPLARPVEQAQRDLREGYVSAQAAHDYYGVVFRDGTHEIDAAATEQRRAALARGQDG